METPQEAILPPLCREGGAIQPSGHNDWQKSIEHYVTMIQEKRDAATAFERLSSCYAQINDRQGAFGYALKAAELFIEKKDFPRALELIHKALNLDIDIVECHRRLTLVQDYVKSKTETALPFFIQELFCTLSLKELLLFWKSIKPFQLNSTLSHPISETGDELLFYVTDGGLDITTNPAGISKKVFPSLGTGDLWIANSDDHTLFTLSSTAPARLLVADRTLINTLLKNHARLKKSFETALTRQQTAATLYKSSTFSHATWRELQQLTALAYNIVLSKEENILDRDHLFFHSLFVIKSGIIRVGLKTPSLSTIKEFSPGAPFYPPLFVQRPGVQPILVLETDVNALIIHRKDLKTLFRSCHSLLNTLNATRPVFLDSVAATPMNQNPLPAQPLQTEDAPPVSSTTQPAAEFAADEIEADAFEDQTCPDLQIQLDEAEFFSSQRVVTADPPPQEHASLILPSKGRDEQPKEEPAIASARTVDQHITHRPYTETISPPTDPSPPETSSNCSPTQPTTAVFETTRTIFTEKEEWSTHVDILLKLAKQREIKADQIIYQKGELCRSFYLLLKGELVLSKFDRYGIRNDLMQLQSVDHFGEEILLDRSVRGVNAYTKVDCLIAEIPSPVLQTHLESNQVLLDLLRDRYRNRIEYLNFSASGLLREVSTTDKQTYFGLGRDVSLLSDLPQSAVAIILSGSLYEYSDNGLLTRIHGPGALIGEASIFEDYSHVSSSLRPRYREGPGLKLLAFSQRQLTTLIQNHPACLLELYRTFLFRNCPDVYEVFQKFETRHFRRA